MLLAMIWLDRDMGLIWKKRYGWPTDCYCCFVVDAGRYESIALLVE